MGAQMRQTNMFITYVDSKATSRSRYTDKNGTAYLESFRPQHHTLNSLTMSIIKLSARLIISLGSFIKSGCPKPGACSKRPPHHLLLKDTSLSLRGLLKLQHPVPALPLLDFLFASNTQKLRTHAPTSARSDEWHERSVLNYRYGYLDIASIIQFWERPMAK